jgi:hypothetical protein
MTMIERVMFKLIRRSITMVGMGSTMTIRIPITPTGIIKWSLPRRFERFGIAAFSATLIEFSNLLKSHFCRSEIGKSNLHTISEKSASGMGILADPGTPAHRTRALLAL